MDQVKGLENIDDIEIWGVQDPNVSAQLALAVKLDLFKREADLDVTCKFLESGTTSSITGGFPPSDGPCPDSSTRPSSISSATI